MGVRTGLDRLLDAGPAIAGLAPGARVALLAHPASVDREARHVLEQLDRLDLAVVRLLAPEHGLYGHEQDMEQVEHRVERHSGLPVTSLYGSTPESLRPTAAQLAGVEAVLIDLQDVGSRYYTFVYTMAHVMEAAARDELQVVVLDRPNPIGGDVVAGPVLQPELSSFVGRYPLPVRHGMTPGELALLFNTRFGIGCSLQVVPLQGWRRRMQFDETGLPWVPPSPNMPTLTTARVYPGGCLIEGTNLSEGRGTTLPFELVGAPWLDGPALAQLLRRQHLPGVAFRAASFRPQFQKHAGQGCEGVQVIVSDPRSFDPLLCFLALIREARQLAPDRFDWRREPYEFETERLAIDLLLGRRDLREQLESRRPIQAIRESWLAEQERFAHGRRDLLLYD